MTTLRDALTEALGQAEAGTLESQPEVKIDLPGDQPAEVTGETSEQREARLRDDKGRFARPQETQAKDPAPVAAPQTRKPPSSWKKDYWGQWDRLGTDPELSSLQEYIEQREADYAKGVSTYKQQWDGVKPIYEAIQPFIPELQQYGIQPSNWIQNLGNAHRTLATGSPEQKLQMFAKLATDYGVPLQALNGGQVDPQFGHVTQTVSHLQQKVNQLEAQRQQEHNALIQQQIDAFSKDAPHFEIVRDTMALLLQSGIATDLKTAYDKAIRLHDDVWQQEQARQAQEAASKRQAEIASKKAAAVSPKSSGPTGLVATGNTKKGLRDVVSEAMETHASGRF